MERLGEYGALLLLDHPLLEQDLLGVLSMFGSARRARRAAVPAMAVTGEGKGRNRATIREPLLMPRH